MTEPLACTIHGVLDRSKVEPGDNVVISGPGPIGLMALDQVCYKELTVTGTNARTPASWPRALKLLEERRINTSALISHRFALSEWPSALAIAESKRGIKILLKP